MRTLIPTLSLAAVISITSAPSALVSAEESSREAWQHKLLFTPTAKQIEIEERGRVVIYDGVRDVDVERAMDEQFHRLHSMMFVRTVVTDAQGNTKTEPETGIPIIEDDDCD